MKMWSVVIQSSCGAISYCHYAFIYNILSAVSNKRIAGMAILVRTQIVRATSGIVTTVTKAQIVRVIPIRAVIVPVVLSFSPVSVKSQLPGGNYYLASEAHIGCFSYTGITNRSDRNPIV